MLEYFKLKYNLDLNPRQPVLEVKRYRDTEPIYLPPEFCYDDRKDQVKNSREFKLATEKYSNKTP
jgi:hypothetical protein